MNKRIGGWMLVMVIFGAAGAVEPPSEPMLWDPAVPVPRVSEIPPLEHADLYTIKKREPESDGYSWLHGVALAWHNNALYAVFGHNRGPENTAGEEARGRRSADGGKTWGPVFLVAKGAKAGEAVSHGVLLSHNGVLWAFLGAFHGERQGVHAQAWSLDDASGAWRNHGVIVKDGFWPMGEPQRMGDGNWIMAGARVGGPWGSPLNPPAVAISHGDDFARWDLVVIPKEENLVLWGEAGVYVEGSRITCIARGWPGRARAYASVSNDYGRTWTRLEAANLPMTTSKPCCGILSTGQRFLICTTAADIAAEGNARYPLTIAVSRPGETRLSRIFRIRDDIAPGGVVESTHAAALSYPCAVEHDGRLYVGYSNDGGRGNNLNSAELAVFPVSDLLTPPERE